MHNNNADIRVSDDAPAATAAAGTDADDEAAALVARRDETTRFFLACGMFLAFLGAVAICSRLLGIAGAPSGTVYAVPPVAAPPPPPSSVVVLPLATEQCADVSGAVRAFIEFAYAPFSGLASGSSGAQHTSPLGEGALVGGCNDTTWSMMPRGVFETQRCTEVEIRTPPPATGDCAPGGECAGGAVRASGAPNGTRVYVLERTAHLPRLPWIRYMYDASRYALRSKRAAAGVSSGSGGGGGSDLEDDVWMTDELFTALASAADSCAEVHSVEYLIRAPPQRTAGAGASVGRAIAHGLYTRPPRPRAGGDPPAAAAASSAQPIAARMLGVLRDGAPLVCETMHAWGGVVTHFRATGGTCRVRFEDGGLFIAHTRPAAPVVTVPV